MRVRRSCVSALAHIALNISKAQERALVLGMLVLLVVLVGMIAVIALAVAIGRRRLWWWVVRSARDLKLLLVERRFEGGGGSGWLVMVVVLVGLGWCCRWYWRGQGLGVVVERQRR